MERIRCDVDRLLRALYGPGGEADPSGGLVGEIRRQAQSISVLERSTSHLHDEVAEVVVTLRRQDQLIDRNATALATLTASMVENTSITRDIRDALITARTTSRIARWLAPTIVAGAAVAAAVKGWAVDITAWIKR